MQPHMDYNPPEPYRSKFKGNFSGNISQSPIDFYSGNMSEDNLSILEKLYMGEISYLDSEVGQVIKKMEDTGLIDDSSIFIVSDHGEHIGEHNHISHYFSLYNEVVHVPLFVKLPKDSIDIGVNPDEDFVSTADIFPTICSMVNHDLGDKNIYSFQEGKRAEVISELFMPSEYDYFIESCKKINPSFSKSDFVKAGMQNQKAIFFKNKKLILRKENNNELFNFRDDYSEQNNILGSSNQEEIASIIDNHMLKITRSKISVGSDKMQERLRKLGYY